MKAEAFTEGLTGQKMWPDGVIEAELSPMEKA